MIFGVYVLLNMPCSVRYYAVRHVSTYIYIYIYVHVCRPARKCYIYIYNFNIYIYIHTCYMVLQKECLNISSNGTYGYLFR